MFRKNLCKILLISLVLGQNCLAKPTDNAVHDLCSYQSKYKGFQPSEKDNQLAPSLQLFKITLSALMDVAMKYAEKAKPVSEQILEDQEFVNLNANDEEVKKFTQQLQKFQEDYKSCEDIEQLFKIVELFSTITSEFYEQEEANKLSSTGKMILKVLKKYDIQKMDDEFEASFNKFATQFMEKYESLKESMKEEKNEIVEKINKWYEEFKTLNNYDDRMEAFSKFVKFYEN